MSDQKRIYTAEEIKEKLLTDQRWLERGVLAIYKRQTEQEKSAEVTVENNKVGFNGVDAQLLSSFAKQIQRGRTLSPKQVGYAKKKMQKYSGQLAKIANGDG